MLYDVASMYMLCECAGNRETSCETWDLLWTDVRVVCVLLWGISLLNFMGSLHAVCVVARRHAAPDSLRA